MTVHESLQCRRSAKGFDRTVEIGREAVWGLIRLANLAPSALNLQPWRYRIVDDPAEKKRLSVACYDQKKVADASAAVVLFGDSRFHEGEYESDEWRELGRLAYRDPGRVRDELFRCGGLWAMAFLLAATEAGWESAPVGGFNPPLVQAALGVDLRYLPILVLLVGRRKLGSEAARLPRRGPEELSI